ncbi:MAG TPA: DUF4157 domain-containing protein [Ramlibacter sp.]|nr:DUF4157 domain-containing protein [Ramlibacter sp.]
MADPGATRAAQDRQGGRPARRTPASRHDGGMAGKLAPDVIPSAAVGNLAIAQALGAGAPLDESTRAEMQARYGVDFSQVRVHAGPAAASSADAMQANAYAMGRDIVFGPGRYAPHTPDGKRLLAHELAHVVQQSRGGLRPAMDPAAPHEQAADQAASAVMHGSGPVAVQGATGVGVAGDWKSWVNDKYEGAKSSVNETVDEYVPEEVQEVASDALEIAGDVKDVAVEWGPYVVGGPALGVLTDLQRAAYHDLKEEVTGVEDPEGRGLREELANKVTSSIGVVKGVATQVTEAVDTAMWVGGEYGDVRDKAAEKIGGEKGSWGHTAATRTMDALVTPLMPALPALAEARDQAKDAGLVDKDTGQASLTAPMSEKLNEWAGDAEEALGAAPRDPEMFSPMEKAEIAAAIGTQVALAFVGVEEVKIAMNVVGALSGLRGVVETIRRSDNWKTDPRFWSSLIGMALSIVGLKHAKAASKITTLLLRYGWVAAAIPPLSALAIDYYTLETSPDLSDEEKRKLEARIKQNWGQAIHVLKDAILHVSQSRGGSSAKPPEDGLPTQLGPAKKGGGTGDEEGSATQPPVTAKADAPPQNTADTGTDATVVPIGAGKGKPQSNASKVLEQKLAKQPADQAGTVTRLPTQGKAGGPPPSEPAVQRIPEAVELPSKIAVGQTHGADGGGPAPRVGPGTVEPTVASLKQPGTGGGGTVTPIQPTKPLPPGGSKTSTKSSASGKGSKAKGSKKSPAAKTAGKPPAKTLSPDMEARLAALNVPPKQRAAFDKAVKVLRQRAAKDPDAAENMLEGLERRFGTPDLPGQVARDQAEAGAKLYPEKGADNTHRQTAASDDRAVLEQSRPTRKASRKALVAESERKGVEGGTRQATDEGFTVQENKSPQQFKEPFGRGPDAWGHKGQKRQLFEFKGESSKLSKGTGKDPTVQMSSKWAGKKIAELEMVGETDTAQQLLQAAQAGDLEGVVYSTKDTKSGEKSTRLKGHQLRDRVGDDIVTDDGIIKFDPAQVMDAYQKHKAALLKAKEDRDLRGLKNL